MNHFALDASALVRRYHNEPGAEVVQVLTDALLKKDVRLALISWPVLAEALAALNRKKNVGLIPQRIYRIVQRRLLTDARDMNILTTTDTAIRGSFHLIEHHNLNASDALFLHQAMGWQAQLPEEDNVVMVAADRRLVRAAEAEGLVTIDPERDNIANVKHFLSSDDRGGVEWKKK